MYWGDYLADTRHLTTIQHGAYLLLIAAYWVRGSLPDDEIELANITGLSLKEWRRHRPALQKLFHSGWQHSRIDTEIARSMDKIAKRRLAGSKGGTVASINRHRRRFP
jgi:uncharacterized protein YdaU (DUF1376 family)